MDQASDLHDFFHHCLVGADFGALQPTDFLADPSEKGELRPFAHGVPCCDPDETEHTRVIWGKRIKETM